MVSSFDEAVAYLNQFAEHARRVPRGEYGRQRIKSLMHFLWNPQNNYPVVHIVGTSWKGSTATILSHCLVSQWYTVWLHLSPHLVDVRERMQVDNILPDTQQFVDLVNDLAPQFEKFQQWVFGNVTYFDVTVAMMFVWFAQQGVDIAFVEAGLWWLLDGTNVIDRDDKITVITKQWYDHQDVLGETLEEITFNDVWVVQRGGTVVSLFHDQRECREMVDAVCAERDANLIYVDPDRLTTNHKNTRNGQSFTYTWFSAFPSIDFDTSLLGNHQLENICLALSTCDKILERDNRQRNYWSLQQTIGSIQFVWRMSVTHDTWVSVVRDGAHNPQKMEALITGMQQHFAEKRIVVVCSFKHNKDVKEMIRQLHNYADHLIFCEFSTSQDSYHQSVSLDQCREYVDVLWGDQWQWSHEYIADPCEAYERAIAYTSSDDAVVLVTGSLYLLSRMYELGVWKVR